VASSPPELRAQARAEIHLEADLSGPPSPAVGEQREDIVGAIDAVSVEGSGLRSLRIGQRVRFELVDEAGRKVARNLQIVTL
jgi:cold shock CspA family protein